MTDERAQMYENAFWMVNRITRECEQDAPDAMTVGAVAESLGSLLTALLDGEPRRQMRRAKWQVSADAAA